MPEYIPVAPVLEQAGAEFAAATAKAVPLTVRPACRL